uniref:Aspartylglucosaminidase n=1 Tax=Globodera rostochiensis TaxID=31243 RepID=A0A914GWT2_GLORO
MLLHQGHLILLVSFNIFNYIHNYETNTLNPTGLPLIVSTWDTLDFQAAAQRAYDVFQQQSYEGKSSSSHRRLNALVEGLTECEKRRCDRTVGFGGSPDERGETTLDAMLMDVKSFLGRIKSAAKVAWAVMNYTEHSLVVGEKATEFALAMGFPMESLSTQESTKMHQNWLRAHCQPNFWQNVKPDPRKHCGPYQPIWKASNGLGSDNDSLGLTMSVTNGSFYSIGRDSEELLFGGPKNHDTIGMILVDCDGNVAAGTSSNGARNKIAGRVGDSPIVGSGAYVDNEVGGAVATGDGDVMMRFVPSFLAVEQMRQGKSPSEATREAIGRIKRIYPKFVGALVAAAVGGEFGAACSGLGEGFGYSVVDSSRAKVIMVHELQIHPRHFSGMPNNGSLSTFLIAAFFSLGHLSNWAFSAPSNWNQPEVVVDSGNYGGGSLPYFESALAQLQAQNQANSVGAEEVQQLADQQPRSAVEEEEEEEKQLTLVLQLPSEIGHVVGMALDPQNRLVLFHRSSRVWDENSFTEKNRLNRSLEVIPNATIAVLDNNSGKVLEMHGRNHFYMPHGLAIDSEGNLWLTDVGSHQVHKLDKQFRLLMSLGEKLVPGSDSKHFCKPTDVAVASTGDFFVADGYCNSRIMKFDRDGKLISQFGHKNSDDPPKSQLAGLESTQRNHHRRAYVPTGTFVTKAENIGRIYAIREKEHFLAGVTSWDRIGQLEPQVFVMDMNTGKAKSFAKGLENAHAIALSDNGDIFVSQLEPKQIIKLSVPSGNAE